MKENRHEEAQKVTKKIMIFEIFVFLRASLWL